MGENISIQEKITVWLNKHPEYRTKTEDEIISAMLSAEDNNLTLNELQELSLFATSALQPEIAVLELEKSPASLQPFTPTKEEETNLLQILEQRVKSTESKTETEKEKNGFIGKAWSFLKNTKLLDWCTDSTNDIKKAREEELNLLQTGNVSQIFKNMTGVEYTKENVEKFLNGEIKTKSEQALDAYAEGQEMAVDVAGDLVSGIAAVGIYTAAIVASPFTGGASIALGVGLATVSGGLIKSGVKAFDSVTGGREYDTFSKDFATGSFSGLLAPVTAGLGGAVGKFVAKTFGVQAVKTIGKETVTQTGLKAFAKSALLNPAGYEYKGGTMIARAVSQGTEMATDGALGGGVDNAFRAGIEGEDIGEGFISGLIGGAAMAPVIGGGFKAAGKMGNKFGNLFHSKNVEIDLVNSSAIVPESAENVVDNNNKLLLSNTETVKDKPQLSANDTKDLYMPDNYWAKNIEFTSRINSKINSVVDRLKGIEGVSSVHEINLAEFIKSVEGYTFKEKEILEDNIDIFLKKLNKLDNPAEKSAEISLAFDILTDTSAKERVNRFAEKLGENTLINSETNTSLISKLFFDLGSNVEMTGKGMWLVSGSENSIYGRINGRGKSVSSIESKLVKEILDLEVKDLTDATLTNLVKDSYGFRVIPGPVQRADIDVKTILRNAAQTHKDQFEDSSIPLEDALSDFYTNGFNGAIWKQLSDKQRLAVRDIAIENRSDAFVDKIIELVSAGKIDISKISNYSTSLDEKLPYFTANQLYKISDAVEARTGKKIPVVSYDGDDFIHKGSTRDSGYTAGQMNLKVVGSDDLMELQFRDSEVDIFAELEHVPYDIQENKLTVRGSKYDAHRKVLNNLDTAGQKLYEKYRSDVYTYYRLKALGVQNCTKPDIVQMFEDAIRRGEKVFKEDYTTSAERNGQLNLISENGLKELHET